MARSRFHEWLAVLAAFVVLNLIYAANQPALTFNGGHGDDAAKYVAMAEQVQRGEPMTAVEPFARRAGTPLLAAAVSAFFGCELETAFKRVNVTANFLSVALLTLFFQRHITGPFARIFVLLFFMIEPHSPVRLVFAYPAYVDPIALAFLVAGLLAIDRFGSHPSAANAGLLALVVGVGTAFRETTLVIGVALIAGRDNSRRAIAWLPLLAGFAALTVVGAFVMTTVSGYSMTGEAWRFVRDKSPFGYALAWLMVFGPMLTAPLFYWRRSASMLRENRALAVYLAAFSILAWMGGTDTERLLVFASPVVYVLVANAIGWSGLSAFSLATTGLVIMQVASARAFTAIRGPGEVLTTLEKAAAYQNLWTQFAPPRLLMIYWLGYGLMSAAAVAWLARSRRLAR